MGYTKKEVEKLNSVTVTFGDTTKAVFQVALREAAASMGVSVEDMAKTWEGFLGRLLTGTRATMAGIYAALAGTRSYLAEIEKGGVIGLGQDAGRSRRSRLARKDLWQGIPGRTEVHG